MTVTFESVDHDRSRLLPLLLEADESEPVVRTYIDDGSMFAIREDGVDVGVLLLIHEGSGVELKNLAVAERSRGRGIGTQAVIFAAEWAQTAGAERLTVGTANSSLDAIRFYQKAGFRMSQVKRGFFDAYPEPIWEDGIQARDMLMFELAL